MKEDVKTKIAALRQKTVENGATEAEALEAIKIVEKLMEKHQITAEQIASWEGDSSKIDLSEAESVSKGKFMEPAHQWLSGAISEFCGTFHVRYRHAFKLVIYGREEDVKVAEYLFHVFNAAIHQGFREWQTENPPGVRIGTRQQQYNSFCAGFAETVRARLAQPKGESTALVVKKTELVKQRYYEVHGNNLRSPRSSSYVKTADGSARAAGSATGSKVNINRPVGTSSRANRRLRG